MSIDEIARGQESVAEMLRQECVKRGVQLDSVEWGQTDEGFDRDLYSLAYTISGTRRVERFTRDDLIDVIGIRYVRERVRSRMQGLMASLAPAKKIGF